MNREVGNDRGSRHTSRSRSIMSSMMPFMKTVKLPPHVDEVLHAKQRIDLRPRLIVGRGLHSTQSLLPGLDRKLKSLPWEKAIPSPKQSTESAQDSDGWGKVKGGFGRTRKVTQYSAELRPDKYERLVEILDLNPYGKIAFTNSNDPMEVTPEWVTYRLEDSCRNARFGLPSDYRDLQYMTPMEYLEKYTILTRGQRRRYDLIFKKFMDKVEKCIMSDKLYDALNSMFSKSLGHGNFHILCVALFLPTDAPIRSKELFAGICALTERLFWSSYIDSHENTFFTLGQNRSLLECADFSGLQWKLKGLDISLEMMTLLFSLA